MKEEKKEFFIFIEMDFGTLTVRFVRQSDAPIKHVKHVSVHVGDVSV